MINSPMIRPIPHMAYNNMPISAPIYPNQTANVVQQPYVVQNPIYSYPIQTVNTIQQPYNTYIQRPVYPAYPTQVINQSIPIAQTPLQQTQYSTYVTPNQFIPNRIILNNKTTVPTQEPSKINAANVIKPIEVQNEVLGYKNNLRTMLISNKADIIAVIPRLMNAQDKDSNELIQGDEISGNLVNAVDRLDEIKDLGFNTQHILPIHPTSKINAMGTAGSLYAPRLLIEEDGSLAIDPELVDENPKPEARKRISEIYKQKTGKDLTKMDKNDQFVRYAQCKYYIEECHKRGIRVMLDLPSCVSHDFAQKFPELIAIGPDGKTKTPKGWQDILMLKTFKNEQTRELYEPVLDLHRKYVDACIDLGFDGIRADVGRAKPVEFWNVIIQYSRQKDPEFAWLAETYTHEDASPMLNMPYDRPQDLLEVGFDAYYGQYHIYNDWTKAQDLYDYVRENIELNNRIGQPKALIGSFATHDDQSPMLYGGAPWVMFTTVLQSMLPQVNPYMTDGTQTGDFYMFPYDHAIVKESQTDNHECTVHTGRMDIFNKSRKPGGDFPEIAEVKKATSKNRKANSDVITKGSFIILPSNNPEIVSFARHENGKTQIFIGNRNVNQPVGGTIEIPGLNSNQKFVNLIPGFGEESKIQNNGNGTINVELGTSRAHVFEINDENIEQLSRPENVMKQMYL